MLNSRFRSYPIVDAEGNVVGAISRVHLINHARKRVVLVDHNEKSQSVAGLEQAEICEIIDHHRLGDVQTGMPMFFRNEPVGSTTTIIAGMYKEYQLAPGPELAKLMLAAILSDTVAFRSPTCTEKDKKLSEWLAGIAGTDADELGKTIFLSLSEKLVGLSAQRILFQDFKEYSLGGRKIGIGQITCWETDMINKDQLQEYMDSLLVKERFDIVLFMLTEIVRDGTTFLHSESDPEILLQTFGTAVTKGPFFLTGIMSRKKQVVPALSRYLI
jgi:manganese-dependent inorganic pyrophosphatase